MQLRTANLKDIDFILEQENRDEFINFVFQWSKEEHVKNLNNPDKQYFIIENDSGEIKGYETKGYVILSGLTSPNRCIELTRIVISEPGKGYGKSALRLILKKVFEDYKAHRLWLDVIDYNQRARHIYQSIGFQEEGILREAVKRENSYDSLVLMSMLAREYFHM